MEYYMQNNQKLLYAKKDSVTGAWSKAFDLQSNFTFAYNKKIQGQFQENLAVHQKSFRTFNVITGSS